MVRPVGPTRPVLLLPDRRRFLQRCRCRIGRRRTPRRDGATRPQPRPKAPRARDRPTRCSSAIRSRSGQRRRASVGDLVHDAARRLLVGLVGHPANTVAALGMVADHSDEANDGPGPRRRGPRGQRVDGKGSVGERHPVARVIRGREHGEQCTERVPLPARSGRFRRLPPRSIEPRDPRSRRRSPSLHSIAMGYRGDEHDHGPTGEIARRRRPPAPAGLAARPARPALDAPERALATASGPRPATARARCGPPRSWPAPPARS